jgi:hypothetical protein
MKFLEDKIKHVLLKDSRVDMQAEELANLFEEYLTIDVHHKEQMEKLLERLGGLGSIIIVFTEENYSLTMGGKLNFINVVQALSTTLLQGVNKEIELQTALMEELAE